MKTIEKAKLDSLLAQLAQNYSLLVPVDYNGLTQFAPYSQVQEGVSQLYLDGNVTVSPKTAYLPQSEAMYKFRAQGKKLAIEEMAGLDKQQVLFGVRHCDTKAIPVSYTHLLSSVIPIARRRHSRWRIPWQRVWG